MTAADLPLLSAQLPDPGNPSIVAFGAVVGGLVGGLVARVRRLSPERVAHATNFGVLCGGWCGTSAWLTTYIATHLL
jgi:hypothetical protein